MPRIDPLKLLTCLKVLLAPNGGIRSANEVKRLAELMAKYSKKLVSKCIYIQILKSTDTELLGKFMGVGGWLLTHMWLHEAIKARNWPLVQEILELLLLCPVDVQRLRSNIAPKLVKGLSKDGGNEGVRILATRLVEQWLKIVKGETMAASEQAQNAQIGSGVSSINASATTNGIVPNASILSKSNDGSSPQIVGPSTGDSSPVLSPPSKIKQEDGLVYKIMLKDGKQIVAKIVNSGASSDSPSANTSATGGDRKSRNLSIDEGDSNASGNLDLSNRDNDMKDGDSGEKGSKDRESERERSRSSKDKDRHRDHKSSSSSSSRHKSSSKSSSSKSGSSSSSKSKSSHSSSSSKHKDKDSSEKDRHKSSSSKSSSSSSSKDKDRDKSRSRDKERERSRSSSDKDRSRSDRDKDKEKDKIEKDRLKDDSSPSRERDTTESPTGKTSPMTIDKLGKIPKKPRDEEPAVTSITIPSKKASMSIEIRRDPNRPKTVKTYNSQFRSHGLSEEAPPPPSRKGLKKPPPQAIPGTSIPTSVASLKRASPPPSMSPTAASVSPAVKDLQQPAEKKLKIDLTTAPATEKPGAVKFIAPKPKPSTLIESDMFMDALSAAAPKKDVRKRKRRPSASKEPGKDPSTPEDPESPVAGKVTPLKFYQDTLEDSDKAELLDEKDDWDDRKNEDEDDIPLMKVKEQIEERVREEKELEERRMRENEEPEENPAKKPPGPGCGPDGPPGVLMLHRRKGPKKKLTWRVQEQLEEIRYFELDENERVNVTKTFTDMKQMERFNEREAFMLARKLNADDVMVEQTPWVPLIEVDDVPSHPEGMQSKEKKIQMEREMTTLKALYFTRHMIPDSASEPDMEQYQITEPAVIPLDDITGNPDAVNDFTSMPWPDPKGSPPPDDEFMGGSDMGFPGGQFNPFLPFGAPGGWMGPGMNNGPPNGMMPPPMGGPMGNFNPMMAGPPGNMMMNGGPPPNMMMGGPPDDMGMNCNMNMMNPGGFGGPGGPGPNFGGPPNGGMGFNNFGPPPMGMNPNTMNMNMNNGPPRGGGGGPRGGNWRSGTAGPPGGNDGPVGGNWRGGNNPRRGGGGPVRGENRGICKQFQRGFCRNGNKCNFFHPPPGNQRY